MDDDQPKDWPFNAEHVVSRACDAAFGGPLINNVLRGQIAETIVALALEPEWRWCGADYSSFDFTRADGLRLEVKQSAYKQSWETSATSKI